MDNDFPSLYQQATTHPDWPRLPPVEQRKVIQQLLLRDNDFVGMPPVEQMKVRNRILSQYPDPPVVNFKTLGIPDKDQTGNPFENFFANPLVQGVYGNLNTLRQGEEKRAALESKKVGGTDFTKAITGPVDRITSGTDFKKPIVGDVDKGRSHYASGTSISPMPIHEPGVLESIWNAAGQVMNAPVAPVKLLQYQIEQALGASGKLPKDIREQKRLNAMPALQRMSELADQPLRNLGSPESEMYRRGTYKADSRVGQLLESGGGMAADMGANPAMWLAPEAASAKVIGGKGVTAVSAGFAASMTAPYIANPRLILEDPAKFALDASMAGMSALGVVHGLELAGVESANARAMVRSVKIKTSGDPNGLGRLMTLKDRLAFEAAKPIPLQNVDVKNALTDEISRIEGTGLKQPKGSTGRFERPIPGIPQSAAGGYVPNAERKTAQPEPTVEALKKGEPDAANQVEKQKSSEPEHPGVPQGGDVSGDKGQVREGEGGQTGGSGSTQPKAEEVKPSKRAEAKARAEATLAKEDAEKAKAEPAKERSPVTKGLVDGDTPVPSWARESRAYNPQSQPHGADWVKTTRRIQKFNEPLEGTWYGANSVAVSGDRPMGTFLQEVLGREVKPFREGWQVTAEEADWLGLKKPTETPIERPEPGVQVGTGPGAFRHEENYPIDKILVNVDVPQFKEGADIKSGVVPSDRLEGGYERLGTGPIVVWEKKNGTSEVITGRHRLDLAKRRGETHIPAQVVKEENGFTPHMAAMFDAEANIRDQKGTVKDYARYFNSTKDQLAEGEARQRGLLSVSKGRAGWDIGRNASDDVRALYLGDKITEQQAATIGRTAPGDDALQRVGTRYALEGKDPQFISNVMQAAKSSLPRGAKATDQMRIFEEGDDSAIVAMEAQANKATEIQKGISERINAVVGAAKRPEIAKGMGVDVTDPEAISKEVAKLRAEQKRWGNWAVYPDLVAQTREEVRIGVGEGTKQKSAGVEPEPKSVAVKAAPKAAEGDRVEHGQGGVPYYRKLGEQDAIDVSRKRMRSVPQNFKLAYLDGWYKARKSNPDLTPPEAKTKPSSRTTVTGGFSHEAQAVAVEANRAKSGTAAIKGERPVIRSNGEIEPGGLARLNGSVRLKPYDTAQGKGWQAVHEDGTVIASVKTKPEAMKAAKEWAQRQSDNLALRQQQNEIAAQKTELVPATTFEVDKDYIANNPNAREPMRVSYRGPEGSDKAVVFDRKSGAQFTIDKKHLFKTPEDVKGEAGQGGMAFSREPGLFDEEGKQDTGQIIRTRAATHNPTMKDMVDHLVSKGLNPREAVEAVRAEIESGRISTDSKGKLLPGKVSAKTTGEFELTSPDKNFGQEGFSFAREASKSPEELNLIAKEHFGVTRDPNEAGYVLSDGTMLDLSGRHYASGYENKIPKRGQPDYLKGNRNVDHRELPDELDQGLGGTQGMRNFMRDSGALRVFHKDGEVNANWAKPLTPEQSRWIQTWGEKGTVTLDATDPKTGDNLGSIELDNPSKAEIGRAILKLNKAIETSTRIEDETYNHGSMLSAMREPDGRYNIFLGDESHFPVFRNQNGFSDNGQKIVTVQELEGLVGKDVARQAVSGADANPGKFHDIHDIKVEGGPLFSRTTSTGIPLESESRKPQRMIAKVAQDGNITLTPKGRDTIVSTLGIDNAFKGAAAKERTVADLQTKLMDVATDPNASDAQKTEARQLLQAIKLAQSRTLPGAKTLSFKVQTRGETLGGAKDVRREEIMHVAVDRELGGQDWLPVDKLLGGPLATKAVRKLISDGYPTDSYALANEVISKLAAHARDTSGNKVLDTVMGLSEDQTNLLRHHIFTVLANHYGEDAVEAFLVRAHAKARETNRGRQWEANREVGRQSPANEDTAIRGGGGEPSGGLPSVEEGRVGGAEDAQVNLSREEPTKEHWKDLLNTAKEIRKEGHNDLETFKKEFLKDFPWAEKHVQKAFDESKGKKPRYSAFTETPVAEPEAKPAGPPSEPPKEPPVKTAEPEETAGVAQRVQEKLSEKGVTPEYVPNKGYAAETLVKMGQSSLKDMAKSGTSPRAYLDALKKRGGQPTAEEYAPLRAHYANLLSDQMKAIDKFGYGSEEQKTAFKTASEWYDEIHKFATESSDFFRGLQGETDIDTGTFKGVVQAYTETVGRDMTPKEADFATKTTAEIERLNGEVEKRDAQLSQLKEQLSSQAVEEIRQQVKQKAVRKRTDVQTERQAIQDRLASRFGRMLSGLPVDAIPDVIKLARTYVEENLNITHNALVDEVHGFLQDLVPDLEKRDVREALSGYGDVKTPSSDPVNQRINQLNRAHRLVLQIEDVMSGTTPLRSGFKPSDDAPEVLDLRAQLDKALDQMGMRHAWRMSDAQKLKSLKTRLKGQIETYERRIREKDFSKRPKPQQIALDEQGLKLRAEKEKLKAQLDAMIEAAKPKTWLQKGVALHREFILSGYSVFEKLLGATVWGFPSEVGADVIGAAPRIFPGYRRLADISGREGAPIGSVLRATGKTLKPSVLRDAAVNSWSTIRTGTNALTALAGVRGKTMELGGYAGRFHGAEKAFLQTAEFNRAGLIRTEMALRQGLEMTPEVKGKIMADSAIDAWNQILQGENQFAGFLNRMIGAGGSVFPAGGAVMRTLAPITKVPANVLGRAAEMTGLGIPRGAYLQIKAAIRTKAGIEITPREAGAIVRAYKYGGLGLVAMYLGMSQPSGFQSGGFYTPEEKIKKDPGFDELKVGGHTVPRILAHSPFLLSVQFWATVRKAYDRGGAPSALGDVVRGVSEQTPGIEATKPVAEGLMGSERSMGKASGSYVRGLTEPQILQQIAKWMDTAANRYPRGFREEMKMGVPKLRETVPSQKPSKGKPKTEEQREKAEENRFNRKPVTPAFKDRK